MTTIPLPVVMLSSLTQSGTDISLKAYELGAVECFPKPLRMTPEQFTKSVAKLGKIVIAAANSNVRGRRKRHGQQSIAHFEWNRHVVSLSASMGAMRSASCSPPGRKTARSRSSCSHRAIGHRRLAPRSSLRGSRGEGQGSPSPGNRPHRIQLRHACDIRGGRAGAAAGCALVDKRIAPIGEPFARIAGTERRGRCRRRADRSGR